MLKIIDNLTTNGLVYSYRPFSNLDNGWIGGWSPGIGDPTIMGWITVVLYALGVIQCYQVVSRHSKQMLHNESMLWWLLVFGLLALGINKQLDLQSAFTEVGRIFATQYGWYESRHKVQVVFIYAVIAVALSSLSALAFLSRKAPFPTILALIGSVCLVSFVVIRASSFHHFDHYIDSVMFGLRMNWILEMGGIFIIIVGARWRLMLIERAVVKGLRLD